MKKTITIIVAIAKNNAIGKDNDLLWRISDDLKRFKKHTTDNTIIMGRNTYFSLPERKLEFGKTNALPNRQNIVLTDDKGEFFNGVDTVYSIEEAIEKAEHDIFIIGGGQVYKTFLPLADKIYLTRVDEEFDADVFFPEIDYSDWLEEYTETIPVNDKNEFDHTFSILVRKNKL